jgi:hypothetical protein
MADDEPPEEPVEQPRRGGGADDRDPAAKAIFYVFVAGVLITIVGAMGMSVQNAVDPTRDTGVPWLGVGAAIVGAFLLGLVIMARRR